MESVTLKINTEYMKNSTLLQLNTSNPTDHHTVSEPPASEGRERRTAAPRYLQDLRRRWSDPEPLEFSGSSRQMFASPLALQES